MNITQTIKDVSKQHSMPVKNGAFGWFLYHPWDITKGKATTQSSVSGSYQDALKARKGYIAFDVAILCGANHEKAYYASHDVTEYAYSIVDAVKRNIN